MTAHSSGLVSVVALALVAATGCTLAPAPAPTEQAQSLPSHFQQDRESILAMAGDYKVTFDFTETVSFIEGYDLKAPKLSGGHESVRVLKDTGEFISLQHTLVVGPDSAPVVVKHWRQDWRYQPERVLVFIGGNAWEWRGVPQPERSGAWSQTVYQVDDAPRYGAVARWTYENGLAEWSPPAEWRPLPRRDMTTRDDYHAVNAVNRHAITPWGWVHEQDNSKLILSGEPRVLVREMGINTYRRSDAYPVEAGEAYWAATGDFWAGVRAEWDRIEAENQRFAITIKGETEDLYLPLLDLANSVRDGEMDLAPALADARAVIGKFVTADIGELEDRLRPSETPSAGAN
ncbi:DUF6607 family protein [Hyphomonas sp.]|uniref:DUF6607 family protein n=1 Tax=Hyphomonas sp. TaxID=87 RepID=UPI003561E943